MSTYQQRQQLHISAKIALCAGVFLILSFGLRQLLNTPTSPWTIHLFPLLCGIMLPLTLQRRNSVRSRRVTNDSHFMRLYHTAPIMLLSMDNQGRLLHVSDHWLQVLGYQRQEVIGRFLTDFFSAESRQRAEQEIYPKFYITGTIKEVPCQMISKQGRQHDTLLSVTADHDEQGNFICSQAVIVDITEKQRDEQRIRQLAYQDQLTQLPNRSGLELLLKQALHNSLRRDALLAVFSLDLDNFKHLNNTLGSTIGNQVLIAIGQRLQQQLTADQVVARSGGDEFVILIPDHTSASQLKQLAETLLQQVRLPLQIHDQELYTSASIGIAIAPQAGTDVDSLLRNANQAMHDVKRHGRNNFTFFSRDLSEQALRKLQVTTDLRRAVDNNELRLFYQPQICGEHKRVSGVEALVRWHHPQLGLLSPGQFIPIAEESGQIIEIGHWVLKTACEQACRWQQQGFDELRMSVNLSPRQFQDRQFIDRVDEILEQTGVDPRTIELEITETVLMRSEQHCINTLTDLKVRGFHIAIDDFGTGYSSLIYLKNFPIDRLKIPREFFQGLQSDPENACLIEAIIALAKSLKLEVVAEGVETREQLQFMLQRCACCIQGFYFAGPMPAPATTHFLSNSAALQAADWALDYNRAKVEAVSSNP